MKAVTQMGEKEERCAVSLDFCSLTKRGLIEDHVYLGAGKVRGLREQVVDWRRGGNKQRPFCDVRAMGLVLHPQDGGCQ